MIICMLLGLIYASTKTAKSLPFQQGITYLAVFADILLVVSVLFLVENCSIIYVTEVKHG